MMKNLPVFIGLAVLFFFSSVDLWAQYLDPGYYGFEDVDVNGDGSVIEFGWFDKNGAGYEQSDDFAAGGEYSLKVGSDDYSAEPDQEWRIDCGHLNKVSSQPQITETGSYELSLKLYIPSGGTPIKQIKIIYSDPSDNFDDNTTNSWVQTQWDLSAITIRDKWITLKKQIEIDVLSEKDPLAMPRQLQIRVLSADKGYRPESGSGYIYIDDIKLSDLVDINDPDFILDEWYFGFENGASSWWIPKNVRDYVSIQTEDAADGGIYSLKYSSEDWSGVSKTTPVSSTSQKGGTLKMVSGQLYEVSIKYKMTGDVQPNEVLTNVKSNAEKVGYQTIKWELPASEKNVWTELTQTILYLAKDADDVVESDGTIITTDMALKLDETVLPGAGSGALYIDDIMFSKKTTANIFVENTLNAFAVPGEEELSVQSLVLSGGGLIDDITITSPDGFEVSLNEEGIYSENLTVPVSGNWINQQLVYIRFTGSASEPVGDVQISSPGAETLSIPLEVSAVTGAVPTERSIVSIYPNPASDVLYFDGVDENSTVAVYNFSGMCVKEEFCSFSKGNINVGDLPTGLYIVKTIIGGEATFNKVSIE